MCDCVKCNLPHAGCSQPCDGQPILQEYQTRSFCNHTFPDQHQYRHSSPAHWQDNVACTVFGNSAPCQQHRHTFETSHTCATTNEDMMEPPQHNCGSRPFSEQPTSRFFSCHHTQNHHQGTRHSSVARAIDRLLDARENQPYDLNEHEISLIADLLNQILAENQNNSRQRPCLRPRSTDHIINNNNNNNNNNCNNENTHALLFEVLSRHAHDRIPHHHHNSNDNIRPSPFHHTDQLRALLSDLEAEELAAQEEEDAQIWSRVRRLLPSRQQQHSQPSPPSLTHPPRCRRGGYDPDPNSPSYPCACHLYSSPLSPPPPPPPPHLSARTTPLDSNLNLSSPFAYAGFVDAKPRALNDRMAGGGGGGGNGRYRYGHEHEYEHEHGAIRPPPPPPQQCIPPRIGRNALSRSGTRPRRSRDVNGLAGRLWC